jgi:hypothetical protein
MTGIERCLKRHFDYTKFTFNHKKQTYKFDYDYSSLSGAVEDALDVGVRAVTCLIHGDFANPIFDKSFLEK